MLTVSYSNRDFTARAQPMLNQSVRFMRWDVRGWCDKAEITASGDYRDVGDLLELLRCPVEVMDEHGDVIWWGYANSVAYQRGSMQIVYSLDTMFNYVTVTYSWISPGSNEVGVRKTTAATSDADSISFYGTKELSHSVSGMTDASAVQVRDNVLAKHKFPRGVVSAGFGAGLPTTGAVTTGAAITISCLGWWHTLGWRYANVAKAGIDSTSVSDAALNVGDNAARTKVLQQFTVGATAMYIVGATLRAVKAGTPADNLTMEIYALDGSGNPTGAALATGANITGAELTGTNQTLRKSFTVPVTLTAGQYGLVTARSGAIDAGNYYTIRAATTAPYTGGVAKTFDGANWNAYANDLYFRIEINPLIETTMQIKDLTTSYGALLDYANTWVINASGVSTYANKDGSVTALAEILEMAALGYSDNARMVCKVTRGRQLEIYKASTTPAYKVDSYNRVCNIQTSDPVQPYKPPIGAWVELSDLMPETADTGRLITPGLQYVTAWEWRDGETNPVYEDQPEAGGALTV